MTASYSWDAMLEDFRALGGVADNIEQRNGEHGNGIFPIDPNQPVAIKVPDSLLVDEGHLILDNGQLVVASEAKVSAEISEFIANYQQHFSWGADGKKNIDTFESGLAKLPVALLDQLKKLLLVSLELRHKGNWEDVLRRQFLQSRRINYQQRKVLMPIMELINHSSTGRNFDIGDGIGFGGEFDGEVYVNYSSASDALQRFLIYGFANQEPRAISLPMSCAIGKNTRVWIATDSKKVERVDNLILPELKTNGEEQILSFLLLGVEKMPRLPRTIIRKRFAELPVNAVDEAFDLIRNANQTAMLDLLELLEGVDTPVAQEFRKALMFQLRALTYCFGARLD